MGECQCVIGWFKRHLFGDDQDTGDIADGPSAECPTSEEAEIGSVYEKGKGAQKDLELINASPGQAVVEEKAAQYEEKEVQLMRSLTDEELVARVMTMALDDGNAVDLAIYERALRVIIVDRERKSK
jgi:hypothetical protein